MAPDGKPRRYSNPKVLWESRYSVLEEMAKGTYDHNKHTLVSDSTPAASPSFEVMRLKALCSISGEPEKVVVQGVYQLFDMHQGELWAPNEARESRMVLIGKDLNLELFRDSFNAFCLL